MILKGYKPLNKEDLEKHIQYFISKNWPQWKRERSLRKGDGEFNSFMEDNNELIDSMEENNEFNISLDDYKEAVYRLEYPVGIVANENLDARQRAEAQATIDATSEDVKTFEG